MPAVSSSRDANIRASRFLLARTVATCRHCLSPTPLFGLAVPPGHMVLELDDEARDDGAAVDAWRIASGSALLFFVEFLSTAVRGRLRQFTDSYRLASGPAATGDHWANHCARCGLPIDDNDLYCEPEGAFVPTNEAAAGLIQLVPVEESFEAVAAGYAYEPEFFQAMGR